MFDWDNALRRLDELNARAEDPALWNDPQSAQKLMRERQRLDQSISDIRKLEGELGDATGMIDMAEAEGEASLVAEAEKSIDALARRAEHLKLQSMLSGEADANDSYLEIHAGAG
ncbi:MAG TPA: PCRF domain-containing protein, partial [Rhizomicrobium sp.]|nr:PCRF domain-containing protein [Rhizomicrobium sp.]